jgi:hypothetical protein
MMKIVQQMTFIFGLVYLALGILGFVPTVTSPTNLSGQGLILGLFAVNSWHNIMHLSFGTILLWGGLSSTHVRLATSVMTVLFILMIGASFVPALVDLFQLNETDTPPHIASAMITGVLALMSSRRPVATQLPPPTGT